MMVLPHQLKLTKHRDGDFRLQLLVGRIDGGTEVVSRVFLGQFLDEECSGRLAGLLLGVHPRGGGASPACNQLH